MALARSRVTADGYVLVPAEVLRKLGVGPGSEVEWVQEGPDVVLQRAGRYSLIEIHKALFPDGASAPRTLGTLRQGIRQHTRTRHARGRPR